MTIKRLLIANRGEIACRILRTAQALGIHTIAIYSDADAAMPHARLADTAVHLPGNNAAETYLNQDKVLAAAQAHQADAIHPGYGFLSENANFSAACNKHGITFIGPSGKAINLMGDKAAARLYMQESGVPVLPGFDEAADNDRLQTEADRIGYPLLIKAVAGGGGKGMRTVESTGAFAASLAAAQREAKHAFGDDQVLLERYLPTARHVEVQIFADTQGNCVHLFERDCSVQRRHQKVIEEAPAPGMTQALRQQMGDAACRAARSINYVGAGTVEFLLAPDNNFYFMEMNTRLQVEHPVTEAITGTDLVAWQIAVAEGKPLPCQQNALHIDGHAMEVRLYAEDAWNGFLPAAGPIDHLQWPANIRIDTGVAESNDVSSLYDPMIAKLISHGEDRDDARQQLIAALDQLQLTGLKHNAGFLRQVLASDVFSTATLSTRLLEENPPLCEPPTPDPALLALAATLQTIDSTANPMADPWDKLSGWRPLGVKHRQQQVSVDNTILTIILNGDIASIDGTQAPFHHQTNDRDTYLNWNNTAITLGTWKDTANHRIVLFHRGQDYSVNLKVEATGSTDATASDFTAPMNGTLLIQHVQVGQPVEAGTALVTLEAMKMEHTLYATEAGEVSEFLAAPGDTVSAGSQLLTFDADNTDNDS